MGITGRGTPSSATPSACPAGSGSGGVLIVAGALLRQRQQQRTYGVGARTVTRVVATDDVQRAAHAESQIRMAASEFLEHRYRAQLITRSP